MVIAIYLYYLFPFLHGLLTCVVENLIYRIVAPYCPVCSDIKLLPIAFTNDKQNTLFAHLLLQERLLKYLLKIDWGQIFFHEQLLLCVQQ